MNTGGQADAAVSRLVRAALERLLAGADLSRAETRDLFGRLMDGALTPAQMAAVLIGLRQKGETAAEIMGAAEAMRARATAVETSLAPILDTCGTGGDGAGTFNISTAAAFVAAAAGIPVAKHGNRSVSSRCGSADVLEALGVAVDLGPAAVVRCLEEVSIGFMFAPRYHSAMRHVGPTRRELGVRTVFNLLGPITNPAGAHRQVVGAFSADAAALLAEALAGLGAERALTLHGAGGLDELSLAGENRLFEVRGGRVRPFDLRPEEAGLATRPDLPAGGDAAENARLMRAVLGGEPGALLDSVLLNAAAALLVADRVDTLGAGVEEARGLVQSGAALARLERLALVSQACAAGSAGPEGNASR